MNPQYRIFYSWQSDNKEANKALRKALSAVAKQLKGENIALEIEEGGGGEGFFSIEDAVRMKIQKCDIFVGDVTPVGNVSLKSKLLPNANVMYEMGIATESMTADRIIAVAMVGEWKVEDMPFDFNHYAMVRYKGTEDLETLTEKIKERIKETNKIERRINNRFFSKRLLNKNIQTKKYLPDTFLENREAKQNVRFFCAPFKMYGFLTERLQRMSFELYNAKRKRHGKTRFKLDISQWDISGKAIDLDKLQEYAGSLLSYLRPNVSAIDNDENYEWATLLKVRQIADKVELLNKKIMIVTSEAGQGKTNFVCDLVHNLFLTDGIPYVFINAYELLAERIAMGLAQEYNFIGNGSLEDTILKAERFCQQNLQYLIIVIDGLNENVQQRLFRNNLTRIMSALLGYHHVKVIMTCRTAFFEQNYDLLKEELRDDLVKVSLDRLHRSDEDKLEKNEADCIIERYAAHFNTSGNLHPHVARELTDNPLLLRIFFETNNGQDISRQDFIDKIDIYEKYYDQLCRDIQKVIEHSTSVANVEHVAHDTFQHILEWMLKECCFRNLPYESVIKALSQTEAQCFNSFLNANMILRHDATGISGGMGDFINFTFEEIRDFLLVEYMVEGILPKDATRFWSLIDQFADGASNEAEGIKRFLFLYAKNKGREDIYVEMKKRGWFVETFNEHVWDVNEDSLTDDDIALVKKLIVGNSRYTIRSLSVYHWSPNKHHKLNLNTLFETLDTLEPEKKKEILEQAWKYKKGRKDYWGGGPDITERSEFVRKLEEGIIRRKEDNDSTERDVLKRYHELLIDTSDHRVYVTARREKNYEEPIVFRSYDYYQYLMTVHKGSKMDFLRKAGATKGFAKKMFGEIYDSIFVEAQDVEEMYNKYYCSEYQDIAHFISMHYCIPKDEVQYYTDALATGKYRVIDFSSLDYGSSSFENLFTSDEMFLRIYNWLNWKEDENKN